MSFENVPLSNAFSIDIPLETESTEVLEILGFEPSAAKQLFESYINRPDPECPNNITDFARGHISVLKSERYDDRDLQESKAEVGLNEQIQSAIIDPEFSVLLWTRDPHYWVEDTIRVNYATLLDHRGVLKRHAGRRIAEKNKRNTGNRLQGSLSE